MPIDRESFKAGMRRLAAAVSVITTASEDGARVGLTATAVTSVCADPPTLLVCINSSTGTHAAITRAQHFAVNVLAAESRSIAARFASPIAPERRFTEGRWGTLATGAPVLESALAVFDCELGECVGCGTHGILLGRIQAVRFRPPHVRPLLYAHGAYGDLVSVEAAAAALRSGPLGGWLSSEDRCLEDALHWGLM